MEPKELAVLREAVMSVTGMDEESSDKAARLILEILHREGLDVRALEGYTRITAHGGPYSTKDGSLVNAPPKDDPTVS